MLHWLSVGSDALVQFRCLVGGVIMILKSPCFELVFDK